MQSMKGYDLSELTPLLGFTHRGETLISKYFEALFAAETNGDEQFKNDPRFVGYGTLLGFSLLVNIGNYTGGFKTYEQTLAEMNKELYILNLGLGISKVNAESLTEKEFDLYSLCKVKADILDSKTNQQDVYFLAKPFVDSYKDGALSKVETLINGYGSDDDTQFKNDFDTVSVEINKSNPLYEDKSDAEILEDLKKLSYRTFLGDRLLVNLWV
jgi:hypothetical protein